MAVFEDDVCNTVKAFRTNLVRLFSKTDVYIKLDWKHTKSTFCTFLISSVINPFIINDRPL